MRSSNSKIRLYADMVIADTILSENTLLKTAQSAPFSSQLTGMVGNYVSKEIEKFKNQDNKVDAFFNFIIPGLIAVVFKGPLGLLVSFALSVFDVDVMSIIRSIAKSLEDVFTSNGHVTPEHIDAVTESVVNDHVGPATQQEADKAVQNNQSDQSPANDNITIAKEIRNAQIISLALSEYKKNNGINKFSAPSWLSIFGSNKGKMRSLLAVILSLFFKSAFAAAGLMVAGQIAKSLIHHEDTPKEQAVPTIVSTQKKFPERHPGANNSRPNNWIETVSNTREGIEDMIVNFAKQVYNGLDGQESNIKNTAGFKAVVDNIELFNHTARGGSLVVIPPDIFTSKKMLVDHFIDEVAEKAP